MKIGIVCYPTVGGSGIIATELGQSLAEKGHQVHFVSYGVPFRLEASFHENIFFHAVDVVTYPVFNFPPYALALAAKMAEVARAEGLDLYHVHYAIPHAACGVLAKEMLSPKALKLVTTLHGTDITLVGNDPSFFSITKFSIERSDAVTSVSNWLKEQTIRQFETSKEIHTIYNFVDLERFKRKECDPLPFASDGEKVIMHISNFRPVKRVPDVVRIFCDILKQMPCKLVLIGDGPEQAMVFEMTRRLGIGAHVTFLGRHAAVESMISCADLLLLPSDHESFGLVALEAMACEVPVVGTDSGGLREVVEDGISGYLLPVGDVGGMANKALQVLSDTKLARKMGSAGRWKAQQIFSADKIVSQYEKLYEEVLG